MQHLFCLTYHGFSRANGGVYVTTKEKMALLHQLSRHASMSAFVAICFGYYQNVWSASLDIVISLFDPPFSPATTRTTGHHRGISQCLNRMLCLSSFAHMHIHLNTKFSCANECYLFCKVIWLGNPRLRYGEQAVRNEWAEFLSQNWSNFN